MCLFVNLIFLVKVKMLIQDCLPFLRSTIFEFFLCFHKKWSIIVVDWRSFLKSLTILFGSLMLELLKSTFSIEILRSLRPTKLSTIECRIKFLFPAAIAKGILCRSLGLLILKLAHPKVILYYFLKVSTGIFNLFQFIQVVIVASPTIVWIQELIHDLAVAIFHDLYWLLLIQDLLWLYYDLFLFWVTGSDC